MKRRIALVLFFLLGCNAAAQPAPEERTLTLLEGKSAVVALDHRASRLSVGQPQVADVVLLDSHDLYLVGKSAGTTNVLLWQERGRLQVFNLNVERDVTPLQARLRLLLPDEQKILVSSSGESVVLAGIVSDVIRSEQAVAIAQAFLTRLAGTSSAATDPGPMPMPGMASAANGNAAAHVAPGVTTPAAWAAPHVINLLTVAQPAQIMLEVKVAEVSRLLMD